MALTKHTVEVLIRIVKNDDVARSRIDSIFASVGSNAGLVRNLGMALIYGAFDAGAQYHEGRYGGKLDRSEFPFSPNGDEDSLGYQLQCTGIVDAVVEAVNKHAKQVPDIEGVRLASRTTGFDHAGTHLTMTDKTEYIVDWWMTLDVDNPIVFRYDDWDNDRKKKGQAFVDFNGFP